MEIQIRCRFESGRARVMLGANFESKGQASYSGDRSGCAGNEDRIGPIDILIGLRNGLDEVLVALMLGGHTLRRNKESGVSRKTPCLMRLPIKPALHALE